VTDIEKQVLIDGLDLLLDGINVSYIYLPDYSSEVLTTTKEPSWGALEHLRNGTIGISDGHAKFHSVVKQLSNLSI
jgi:hypothetical protein